MDYSTISAEELALTCFRTSDELAWAEFVRRFHPLIARVVVRVAGQWGEASAHVVDDLIQDTYLKICSERVRFLETFTPAHKDAIFGYIKVFTANLVRDHFKARRSEKRGGLRADTSIDGNEPAVRIERSIPGDARIERDILIRQVDACLRAICVGSGSERDRQIFWLYFRVGLAARSIAALPTIGLSTKGVESTILRLTRQIRERLGGDIQPANPAAAEGIRPTESL